MTSTPPTQTPLDQDGSASQHTLDDGAHIPVREHPVARSRHEQVMVNTIDLGTELPFSL